MRISTAASRSPAIVAGGGEAVEAGHLDVEDHEVGLQLTDELDRLVAPAGLADDVVTLLDEELLEVEADDRFVLGDDDAGTGDCVSRGHRGLAETVQRAESSAEMRSRRASCSRSSSATVPRSESRWRASASAWPAGVARLDVGERGLGHERAQAGVLRLFLEEHELLFGDGQLDAQPLEPFADIHEAPLEDRTRHGPRV